MPASNYVKKPKKKAVRSSTPVSQKGFVKKKTVPRLTRMNAKY